MCRDCLRKEFFSRVSDFLVDGCLRIRKCPCICLLSWTKDAFLGSHDFSFEFRTFPPMCGFRIVERLQTPSFDCAYITFEFFAFTLMLGFRLLERFLSLFMGD